MIDEIQRKIEEILASNLSLAEHIEEIEEELEKYEKILATSARLRMLELAAAGDKQAFDSLARNDMLRDTRKIDDDEERFIVVLPRILYDQEENLSKNIKISQKKYNTTNDEKTE